MGNPFDLYIFDLDGTLLDTLTDLHLCINGALEQMELPVLPRHVVQEAIGPSAEAFGRVTLGGENLHRLSELLERFRVLYYQRCLDHTRPFPGIPSVLERLDSSTRAIATNKPLRGTRHILDALGLSHHFDTVIGPETVERVKPHPDMILYALDRAGVEAGRTLMIGDTENDLQAAAAAGVWSCLVEWGYSLQTDKLRESADFVISTPEQLLELNP